MTNNQTDNKKPLALVIEDDYDNGVIFSRAVEAAGFLPEVIVSGDQALARLADVIPQLIILDLHLPQASGKDILRYIRTNERLMHTNVLLATADALLAEQLRSAATLVLLKPIDYVQIRDLAQRFYPNDN